MGFLGWKLIIKISFRKCFFKQTIWPPNCYICVERKSSIAHGIGPSVRQGLHSVSLVLQVQRSWTIWVVSRHYFWLILLSCKWVCLLRANLLFVLEHQVQWFFFFLSSLVIFLLKKPFIIGYLVYIGLLLNIICLTLTLKPSFWKRLYRTIVIDMLLY